MSKLSVTIITLNEEKDIARCLDSIKGLAEEIVLVDSGSTDQTVEIAKSHGATVYYRKFDNFANQKNFTLSKASGDWILSIDADEIITPELANEIKTSIAADKFIAYLIPRRNFILGAEIKHSRWSPDAHIWLWKKSAGKWVGEVHEEVMVNGSVGTLQNGKIHYQDKTIDEFIKSNDLYSTLLAQKLFDQKVQYSFFKMIWEALFEFGVRFIYKLGVLDGWRGFVLAVLMAKYKVDVWVKLLKLYSV